MPDKIPSRHSDAAVLRYAPHFITVRDNYPEVVIIDPTPLSVETFANRFRDAVQGVMKWGTGKDYYHCVSQWAHDFTVASLPGTSQLLIGSSAKVRARLKSSKQTNVGIVVDANLADMDVVHSPTNDVIEAICVLLGYNFLPHAVLTGTTLEKVQAVVLQTQGEKKLRPIEVVEQNGTITLL